MLMEQTRDRAAPAIGPSGQQAADRRLERRRAVLLRAKIFPVDVFCEARIRDVSAAGLRVEADAEMAIGQTVHVTADEQTYHAGVVKWTLGREFGLSLPDALGIFAEQPDDVDHGGRDGHHPRATRSRIDATARIVAGRPPRPATIRNVSSIGMLLDTCPGLKPGQHLVVTVGSASPIYGRVQWTRESRLGFKAEHPVSVLATASTLD